MTQVSKLISLHKAVNRGRRARGESYVPSVISALNLALFRKFSPKEITTYALYSPSVRAQLPVLISKEASLEKLRLGNSYELQYKTEDKLSFYRICAAAGLPIPKLLGAIGPSRGETSDGSPLSGETAWVSYLDAQMPEHFVTKDIRGAYASGFATYSRDGDRFVDARGVSLNAAEVYRRMTEAGRDLLLQERLFDHPELTRLSGRRTLQSIRITTRRASSSEVHILFCFIKIVSGTNIADNFLGGSTGNVLGLGDREPMVLRRGLAAHPHGGGLIEVDRHPDTGVTLDGFEVPCWREAYELVRRAHSVFSEFATLGWDVALTADGPKLIEANAWWDPPTYAPHIMSPEDWRCIFV